MSLVLVTTLGGTIGESTVAAELLAAAPLAVWGGAMVAAVEAGKLFSKLWNKTRNEIPNIEANIEAAQLKLANAGANYLQIAVTDIETNLNTYLKQASTVDKILNTNFEAEVMKLSETIKKIDTQTFELYKMWITTLALFHVAGSDNAFYTLNKDNIDNLIGAYTSNPVEADSLINFIEKISTAWETMKRDLINWEKRVQGVITTVIIPTNTRLPKNIPELTTTRIPTLDIDKLINGGITNVYDLIESLSGSLTQSATKTENEDDENKKKKKKRKKFKRKKQKKAPKKKYIKQISLRTPESEWIEKISFTFYRVQRRTSNDRGIMRFHLKKGGTISKVRVKRGTFSVIALWSAGTKLGVGYRYWSQFNKKAIVNRDKVLSWVIPLITPEDREIAIPLELQQKMVKYK